MIDWHQLSHSHVHKGKSYYTVVFPDNNTQISKKTIIGQENKYLQQKLPDIQQPLRCPTVSQMVHCSLAFMHSCIKMEAITCHLKGNVSIQCSNFWISNSKSIADPFYLIDYRSYSISRFLEVTICRYISFQCIKPSDPKDKQRAVNVHLNVSDVADQTLY